MDTKIHITLGFKVDDTFFGWYEGELYQLPYMANGRYYGLRKVRKKTLKKSGWVYYHIRRKKFGLERIKAMLQKVDWEVNKPVELLNQNNNGK